MQAYKNACAKAGPVLMEPIMKLEVVTPEENMGDVIGDLNNVVDRLKVWNLAALALVS